MPKGHIYPIGSKKVKACPQVFLPPEITNGCDRDTNTLNHAAESVRAMEGDTYAVKKFINN